MKKITKFKTCKLFEQCGDACAKCPICEAPKGRYGIECEDCNSCRDGAMAAYQSLLG